MAINVVNPRAGRQLNADLANIATQASQQAQHTLNVAEMVSAAVNNAVIQYAEHVTHSEITDVGNSILGNTVNQNNNGQIVYSKGEYSPPGLNEAERKAYGEAVHKYKDIHGIPPDGNVPKEILNEIGELVKEKNKPLDAAEKAKGPPDGDLRNKKRTNKKGNYDN